ncbi:MAG: DUF4922 domain-containing protein [Duncaniella sp.]|nr:DUF4922 domain-containing protein [Duncaniella sp.]
MKQSTPVSVVHDIVENTFSSQVEEWDMLKNNYEIFNEALSDEILFEKCFWSAGKILLSYRKASLSANLSAIENGERPCFLCRSARPAEQRSVEWKDYEILANPYPASDLHLTIVCKEHTPQRIVNRITDMAELARMLPEYAIFYNGPKCGASAPDHMHFQAVNLVDVANFNIKHEHLIEGPKVGKSSIYFPRPNMTPFGYFIMDVKTYADTQPMFERILRTFPDCDDEPMMNVVAFRVPGATRIVIIPRKNHRPECYGTGNDQMLVSPASIEMMGKFITSRREDYDRLDEGAMQEIYNDVAYTTTEFIEFAKRLSQ